MTDTRREFEALREKLGKLDDTLVELLDARAKIAAEAALLRKQSQGAPALIHPLSASALEKATGTLPVGDLRRIVGDIEAACSALENPARIVFAGPYGGAAHAATRRHFSVAEPQIAKESSAAALEEVVRKRADVAIVPLESSMDGPVQGTVLALSQTDLKISEILDQSTELHAFRSPRGGAAPAKKLIATTADHEACSRYVASLVAEGVTVSHVPSALDACRAAAEDDSAVALALDPFGIDAQLTVARPSVGDSPGGRTRYALVSPRPHARTGKDATAVVFTVRDAPGALLAVLNQFAEREINLTNIYSRPITGGPWAYLFFVEVSGHFTDRAVVTACEDVKKLTTMFKVVGAYPAAVGD